MRNLYALPFLLLGALACTRENPIEIGKPRFKVQTEEVTRLWIIRNFEGEAPWSAQVVRRKSPPAFEPAWSIESAPTPLSDTLADEGFIRHLLDTLKTLTPRAEAKTDELAHFGLQPPRVQIEWTQGNPPATSRVLIGHEVSAQAGFARFALFDQSKSVFETEGATLRMLDYAKDWTTLRYKNLALWETDDVDWIEIKKDHHLERTGLEWDEVRGKSKKAAARVRPLLENLMHQRVLNFLDGAAAQTEANLLWSRAKKPLTVTLKTRKGLKQTLTSVEINGRVLVRNSLRGDTIFEAYPKWNQTLRSLTQ